MVWGSSTLPPFLFGQAQMSKTAQNARGRIPIVDPKLAAAATLLHGHLEHVTQDPTSGKVTFHFQNLPHDFLEQIFNGELTVNLRDYLSALEHVNALIAQYRARRARP